MTGQASSVSDDLIHFLIVWVGFFTMLNMFRCFNNASLLLILKAFCNNSIMDGEHANDCFI